MNLTPFRLFFFIAFAIGLSSCLDDDNASSSISYDAQIYSFSLTNTAIDGLSNTTFTIDHINGRIFNTDSLAYGTEVGKVLCSLTTRNASRVLVMAEATNDTVAWSSTDSIDFSKPVVLEVYSQDGSVTKKYVARLNVHQHRETGYTWNKVVDKATNRSISAQKTVFLVDTYYTFIKTTGGSFQLFTSFNAGQTWLSQTLTGFPSDADLFSMTVFDNKIYMVDTSGNVYVSSNGRQWSLMDVIINGEAIKIKNFIGTRESSCHALIDRNGQYYFGVTSDMTEWEISNEVIPEMFPVSGFGAAFNKYGLILVGGKNSRNELLNTTWLNSSGNVWIQTTDQVQNTLEKVEGAALAYYADRYYLVGGSDASGSYTNDIFVSETSGVTWEKADSLTLTDLYEPRAFASVHVTSDNELLLFGGTNGVTWFDDVWRGILNELLVGTKNEN